MRRRTFLKGSLAAAILPRVQRRAHAAPAARVLNYVPHADLTILDPVVTTANITRYHGLMIWDQLYGIDSSLRPQPQMVEGCAFMMASLFGGGIASHQSADGRRAILSVRH